MQLIDTHNHLYLPEFDSDRAEVVKKSVDAGLEYMMMPNIDVSSVTVMMESAKMFDGFCLPMIGLHPTSVKQDYAKELDEMHRLLSENRFYGIGETGIDLYWDKTFKKEQVISFREHLSMAEEKDLPVIIHSRDSLELVFEELEHFGSGRVKGILHAFPGNGDDARHAVELGFFIGIGGVVTFKNALTAEAALSAGLENIVLETDAPYLTPVPHRGKRNEGAYLTFIADKLASLFSTDLERVGKITTENAKKLFNLK